MRGSILVMYKEKNLLRETKFSSVIFTSRKELAFDHRWGMFLMGKKETIMSQGCLNDISNYLVLVKKKKKIYIADLD